MRRLLMLTCVFALGAAQAAAQTDSARTMQIRGYPFDPQQAWLGMAISCSHCSVSQSGRRSGQWAFSEPPTVHWVEANGPAARAGLRTGDTLLSIDGVQLVSPDGGDKFGSIRPRQELTIRFRRDGRESEAHLVVGTQPYQASDRAMADRLREMAREREVQAAQARRTWEESQRALERQHDEMQRTMEHQQEDLQSVMEQLRRAQEEGSDSSRLRAVRQSLVMMDSAAARWRAAESLYAQVPARPALAPAAPMPPMEALPAAPPAAALAPTAPMSYAEHREFGPLRYSGRLGDGVIEARSASAVTTTEVTDSEVVVTSRDLSVRIAIRPVAPRPKPAPTPRPARPARPAQPPQE